MIPMVIEQLLLMTVDKGVSCLGLFLSAPVLVPMFSLTPATAAIAIQVLRWCAMLTAIFCPMSFTLPNALRAAGDAKFTMVVSLLSLWICRIGMSYLLGSGWELGLLRFGWPCSLTGLSAPPYS